MVNGQEFHCWKKTVHLWHSYHSSLYECVDCTIKTTSEEGMKQHIRAKHIRTYQQKLEEKRQRKAEQKQHNPLVACGVCWVLVKQRDMDAHNASRQHQKRLDYVDGTGCDYCRMIPEEFDLNRHLQTKLHKQKEKYEEGTGCDICKLETRRLSRYPVRPQDDVLQLHNYSSYEPHRRFSEYQEGTGCDVCKHFQPPHEQNKGHQKTLSRMKYLYNHKYIQTTRQKSARF